MVTGIRSELALGEETDTGSRLGLAAMDVPASIDVIDSSTMEARGYQRLSDAVETTPGVIAGQNPAAPSSFSMRGFTRSQITVLLEQFARDSATTIGGIASRGLELAAAANPTDEVQVGANVAITDAIFQPSANFVQFAGNTPPNVPNVLTNLWGSFRNRGDGLPLEVGGAVRIVGDRQANNANTIVLNGYALADAWVAWAHDRVRLTFAVDNLTDTAYASWSDVFYLGHTDPSFFYANTLMLGLPRTYSVMLQTRF